MRTSLHLPRIHALRKAWVAVGLLVAVLAAGTLGYMLLEGWSFSDAFFMTIITVATVGYGEVHALDTSGRWLTIFLILGGMGTLVYSVTHLTAFIVEGEFRTLLRRNRMDKRIEKISGHYIVCGAGRVGRNIAEELCTMGHPTVVVDRDPDRLAHLDHLSNPPLVVVGDATDDEVLEKAGVHRASGFVAALATDSDNLFVVVSVRQLNPDARIIARVNLEEVAAKMLRAGADKTICPAHIGGLRMASELIRPNVVDFLDKMLRERNGKLRVEEARVTVEGELAGKTLQEAQIPKRTGCVVMARRVSGKEFEFNPRADALLSPGDVLIALGEVAQIRSLKELTGEV